jgi:ubiquinone/menaquinone biosynthesis C-methylase UbiE
MTQNQKEIFLKSEGDQWFLRNKDKILSAQDSLFQLDPLTAFLRPGMNVLEIGCSVGASLNKLNSLGLKLNLFGIDPSQKAIEEGSKIFPFLKLNVGTAEDIDKLGAKFDFIIFGFCLYLIDRDSLELIKKKVSEVLVPGGFLGIIDFDPKGSMENKYSHKEGVTSFKMDYSNLFLDSPEYYLVCKQSWSHAGNIFHEDKNERCSTQIIYREKN